MLGETAGLGPSSLALWLHRLSKKYSIIEWLGLPITWEGWNSIFSLFCMLILFLLYLYFLFISLVCFPRNNKKEHLPFIIIKYELCFPPIHNPLMKYLAYYSGKFLHLFICFPMNMHVQIILCFSVYVPLYRIYSNSQVGTSCLCHNVGVGDVNEIIELDHDVEGLEEVPNLPQDILEALWIERVKGPSPI